MIGNRIRELRKQNALPRQGQQTHGCQRVSGDMRQFGHNKEYVLPAPYVRYTLRRSGNIRQTDCTMARTLKHKNYA